MDLERVKNFTFDGAYTLLPGPEVLPQPPYSVNVHGLVEYQPEEVAEALLELPGVSWLHPPEPGWWDWEAAWEDGERMIVLTRNALLENEAGEEFWGGALLECGCLLGDVSRLLEHLRHRFPAIYLHDDDDCQMFTAESFLDDWRRRLEWRESAEPVTLDEFLKVLRQGKTEELEWMIGRQPELVRAREEDGSTPLHRAFTSGYLVDFLVAHGAEVDARNRAGNTPLAYAAKWVQADAVEALARHGAEVSFVDDEGRTPLHRAVENGREDVVRLLLAAGANPNARDPDGRTPRQLAVYLGKEHLLPLLPPRESGP